MSITFTGYMTISRDIDDHYSAATVNALLATAPENLTIANLDKLRNAAHRIQEGENPNVTISTLLTTHG